MRPEELRRLLRELEPVQWMAEQRQPPCLAPAQKARAARRRRQARKRVYS